ncbi:GumC family protein [Spirosoma aerophilum]
MKPNDFLRLLKKYALWFILIPAITAGVVFYLTRNETKVYKSQATLYTGLASGYSLLSVQNNSFSDRSAVAFDNLITTLTSTETLRQIAVGMLTKHLQLQKPDKLSLSPEAFAALQQAVPADLRRSIVTGRTNEEIFNEIDRLSQSATSNPIKTLVFESESIYSVPVIADKLKASRKNTNDMMVLEYQSEDPAVAQQILTNAIETLSKRYTLLKTSETNSVVSYYNTRSQQAKQRLSDAERKLQAFSVQHKVLDFDQESRGVASSREGVVSEYNHELMRNKAAKASMDALAQRMGKRGDMLAASTEYKAKQEELIDAQNKLVNARVYSKDKNVLAQQQAAVDQMKADMEVMAQKYYAASNNSESIPQATLTNDWLNKVLEYEESSARLKLYASRMGEFDTKTTEFTPLSSELRQLNRDLASAEKEYQASVDNLDKAMTQHQNFTVDGTLSVLDKPNFPLKALPSKRLILLAGAIGVGLFLALILVGIRFWIDQRISSPEKAAIVIGRPVAAMFPTVRKFSGKTGQTAMSIFEQLCNAINIEIIQTVSKPHPPIITLFSIRSKQGKSWTGNGLAHLYAEAGQQIAYFYPRLSTADERFEKEGVTFLPYTLRPDFMNVLKLEQLLEEDESFVSARYDKVILELPPLVSSPIPVYLIDQSYLSILVIDANNSWGRTEKQHLQMYMRIATHPVLTVLNRVGGDYLDKLEPADVNYQLKRPENFLADSRRLPTGV